MNELMSAEPREKTINEHIADKASMNEQIRGLKRDLSVSNAIREHHESQLVRIANAVLKGAPPPDPNVSIAEMVERRIAELT